MRRVVKSLWKALLSAAMLSVMLMA